MALVQGVTCQKQAFCALSVEQMALHLTTVTRNAGHGVPFDLEFRGTVGEVPVYCPKSRPDWDDLSASVILQ